MFQISGDAIAGIVVGFVLGVLAHRAYDRLMYEVVEEKKPEPEQTAEQKNEPRTYGRSCQKFSSAMNINSPDKCQYLNQVSGHCSQFNRQVFILGGKFERCAECKQKYP